MHNRISFLLLLTILIFSKAEAQQSRQTSVQRIHLKSIADSLNKRYSRNRQAAIIQAKEKGWLGKKKGKTSSSVLQGLDTLGFPVYFKTFNYISAATTQTTAVQPGGNLGLNLTGGSIGLEGELGIWDEGIVHPGHIEFSGKFIDVKDGSSQYLDHSSHVTGTLIAKGINTDVKGMAFGARTLQVYDYNNDQAEMAAAAGSLLISNHSYGYEAGWNYNTDVSRWEWAGLPGDSVDFKYGFYSNDVKNYDEIAFYSPDYLIVEAAGNSHGETGPVAGGDYYGYAGKADPRLIDRGPRPAGISSNDAYDVIPGTGNAKNIMTVGAVNQLPDGPVGHLVQIAPYSSWGPTDDGRIKPDICGNGQNVLSTGSSSPNAYFVSSGTSMATPNVSGSLFLLQEYYAQRNNGNFMRSATLKALACHTAYDAGNPGPDYVYGWGVLDMSKAAQAITSNGGESVLTERTMTQGDVQTYQFTASGNEDLRLTICWTDPPGEPSPYGRINDRNPKLINDLDIRVNDAFTQFFPWTLDPDRPFANAVRGDNIRDNIEQVVISKPVPGRVYTVTVSHKGRLKYQLQDYSLVATGIKTILKLAENQNNGFLSIFPIPARSMLHIALNSAIAQKLSLTLYNSLGQKVFEKARFVPAGAFVTAIDTGNYSAGLYTLNVSLGSRIMVRKVIVAN